MENVKWLSMNIYSMHIMHFCCKKDLVLQIPSCWVLAKCPSLRQMRCLLGLFLSVEASTISFRMCDALDALVGTYDYFMFSLLVHWAKLVGYSYLGLYFLRALNVLGGKLCPWEGKIKIWSWGFRCKRSLFEGNGMLPLKGYFLCAQDLTADFVMGCAVDTLVWAWFLYAFFDWHLQLGLRLWTDGIE